MKLLRTNLYIQQSYFALDIISWFAGLLLPLAFAPLNFYFLAFLSPGLFFLCLLDGSVKRALWRGWLFGFGFYLTGTSWVFVSIHVFGHTNVFVAGLLTALWVGGLGLLFLLQAYLFVRLFRSKNIWTSAIGFAALWVLIEWFRTWFLTGFPWLLLGNSQLTSPLKHFAPIISVYGISFLVVLISVLLANIIRHAKSTILSLVIILLLFVCGALLGHVHWTSPSGKPLQVSLVQGDISQSIKWDPKQLQVSLQRYKKLTDQHWASWVVWPEGAVPDLYRNQKAYFVKLNQAAKRHSSTLTTGTVIENVQQRALYNGLVTLGDGKGTYLKRHLVPFGEYLPLQNLLRGLINFFDIPMSSFSAGPEHQALITVSHVKIAPFLCYEIAYLNLLLPSLPQANLLMTASDDSWFGKSWAAAQQLQMSQMRSLESGRDQAVVANDGYTALVNADGIVTKQLPRYQIGVLTGNLQPRQGSTPLVVIGWVYELCALLIIMLLALWLGWRKRY
jgi:apolipoprotein N-acyltransferase